MNVGNGIGGTQLAGVGDVGAQDTDFLPGEVGSDDQPIELIVSGLTIEHGFQGFGQPVGVFGEVDSFFLGNDPEGVDPLRLVVSRGDRDALLVDHPKPEVVENRSAVCQIDLGGLVELETGNPSDKVIDVSGDRDLNRARFANPLQVLDCLLYTSPSPRDRG